MSANPLLPNFELLYDDEDDDGQMEYQVLV